VVHTLATCEWVQKGQPQCLTTSDSGTGTSHLLIALGTEAAVVGYRVTYTLPNPLANRLVEAADEMTLAKPITRYGPRRPLVHRRAGQHATRPPR
jgi:DNA replication protein DnaC